MSRVYVIKDKMADGALRRLCVSYPRFNGTDFCGEVTSHFWSSGGQLKRAQTYCVELLALYLRGMIIQIQYSMMYLGCAGAALTRSPPPHPPPPDGKSFDLLQLRVWTTKELTHTLVYICFSFPSRHIIWRFTQSSGITFILKSSFHVVLIGLWKSGITITCTCLWHAWKCSESLFTHRIFKPCH